MEGWHFHLTTLRRWKVFRIVGKPRDTGTFVAHDSKRLRKDTQDSKDCSQMQRHAREQHAGHTWTHSQLQAISARICQRRGAVVSSKGKRHELDCRKAAAAAGKEAEPQPSVPEPAQQAPSTSEEGLKPDPAWLVACRQAVKAVRLFARAPDTAQQPPQPQRPQPATRRSRKGKGKGVKGSKGGTGGQSASEPAPTAPPPPPPKPETSEQLPPPPAPRAAAPKLETLPATPPPPPPRRTSTPPPPPHAPPAALKPEAAASSSKAPPRRRKRGGRRTGAQGIGSAPAGAHRCGAGGAARVVQRAGLAAGPVLRRVC